jgi:hypothetical protein
MRSGTGDRQETNFLTLSPAIISLVPPLHKFEFPLSALSSSRDIVWSLQKVKTLILSAENVVDQNGEAGLRSVMRTPEGIGLTFVQFREKLIAAFRLNVHCQSCFQVGLHYPSNFLKEDATDRLNR